MEGIGYEAVTTREEGICRDELANYKGSAQVWITHLDFPHPIRQIDRRVITQLKRDFDGEGCIKIRPEHRIPAVIGDSMLHEALQKLAISSETFKATSRDNPLKIDLGRGAKLECLHGQHRILAAKEYLVPSLRWWILDLYSTNLDKYTKQSLREGNSYSAKYTSGEIFRYMRLCHYENDALGVQRWRGRLSNSQDQFLSQLFKRGMLISALDSVLHIQGLWRTFYVGSLDVFLNLKCDEEIARYIVFIDTSLKRVIGDDKAIMMNTDPFTIESIQSRAPALSKSDFEFIQENMDSLFLAVTDPVRRADITQRLLAMEEPIPNLYTLLKDIRYMKQPAAILGSLLPKSRKATLRQRYHFHFTRVESSEHTFELQQSMQIYTTISDRRLDSFDLLYQQLWLSAYRVCKSPSAYGRFQIATLAHRFGFSSTEIDHELRKDPDQSIIEKAVLEALSVLRPNERIPFDANRARPLTAAFHDYLGTILKSPAKSHPPSITVAGSGEPLTRRCGYSSSDAQDLEHLFLDKINAPLNRYENSGNEISSFLVKRSRHRAFFGAVNLIQELQGQSSDLSSSEASVEHGATVQTSHDLQPADSASIADGSDLSPTERTQAQDSVPYTGRMVRFKEHNTRALEVPYEKKPVNEQARAYASQGKKLSVNGSGHFIWQDCFDIISRTKQRTVQVSTTVGPINGKRRFDEDLPEHLQPRTKEAFEFEMDDSEESEL